MISVRTDFILKYLVWEDLYTKFKYIEIYGLMILSILRL